MLKRLVALVTAMILVCALPFTSLAAPDIDRYTDEVGLLSQGEYETIKERLDTMSEELQFDVGIVVAKDRPSGFNSVEELADAVYEQYNFGYGPDRDGIIFLIDMGNREYHFSTAGKGTLYFGDDTLEDIDENYMLNYLIDGDYYSAFYNFTECVETVMSYDPANGPAVVDPEGAILPDDIVTYEEPTGIGYLIRKLLGNIAKAFIPGFMIAWGYVASLRKQLKSVGFRRSASNYMSNSKITNQNDMFLYTNTVAVPRPRNNNSGPRSGGGIGGGIRVGGGGGSIHMSSGGMSHGGRSGKF